MKAYIIKASAPGPFKQYKKSMGAPPQNIFALAATTPPDVEVILCDETINMKPKYNLPADIVAILFHTPDALHAYKMADKFRSRGYTVVLGGLHTSFLSGEAFLHADAVMIGETEGIWEQLLKDFREGRLKPFYKREKPVDLSIVQAYPTNLIPPSKYNNFWSVLVSRGCVHKCEYCTVPEFFCGKYRLRPIENIVAEIKAAPSDCWFELHADNLTADRQYALDLFNALKPLNIKWMGEATIKLADDEELLKAAAESGCKGLLIGIETPSQSALQDSGKGFVTTETTREKIKRFHEHGISITSSMIFGFDTHTKDIFQETLDFCREIEIDEVESVLLIPFPGTPLYKRLEQENRILSKDWSLYDGSNVVFKPSNMTAEELKEGSVWFWTEIQRKNKSFLTKGPGSRQSEEVHHPEPAASRQGPVVTSTGSRRFRWKSILALGLIGIGLYFDIYWIWGFIFILWALGDLKSGYTYLMEMIPRSESPVFYWVVVTMWLSMGIWSFLFSPFSILKDNRFKAPPAVIFKQAESVKEFSNNKYLYSVKVPKNWTCSEQKDQYSITADFREPLHMGSMTLIAIDFQYPIKLKDFITYMEKQLAKDMPPVNSKHGKNIKEKLTLKGSKLEVVAKEYTGNFQGQNTRFLIAYSTNRNLAYTLIGTSDPADDHMSSILIEIIKSFKLKEKKS